MSDLPIRIHLSTDVKDWQHVNIMSFIQAKFPDEVPSKEQKALRCRAPLANSQETIEIISLGNHLFINEAQGADHYYNRGTYWDTSEYRNKDMPEIVDVDPFVSVKALGNAYHKKVTKRVRRRKDSWEEVDVHDWDTYNVGSYGYDGTEIRWNYLDVSVTVDGVPHKTAVKFSRPNWGTIDLSKCHDWTFHAACNFFGLPLSWAIDIDSQSNYYDNTWSRFHTLLKNYEFAQGVDAAWSFFFGHWSFRKAGSYNWLKSPDSKSIGSVEKKKAIAPNLAKLREAEPNLFRLYQFLHSSKVTQGVSNNQLLAAWLKDNGSDYEKMSKSLRKVMDVIPQLEGVNVIGNSSDIYGREICLMFDEAKEKDEEKRAHKEWYLKKNLGDQATGLGCDAEQWPKTHAAIASGEIPINVFHNPGDKLNLVNTEFELWERALKRGWGGELFAIAKDASRHSTYEKDITPYIAFLFKIEKYLDRHTGKGKKWKASPKYVQSQWDLEMEAASETGTVKKRSALTPLADNEARTVEVPFAAIAIYGRQTTYCYSKCYYVLEEGMIDPESKSPVVYELEKKLNNRDDYGLMYYTLNGTPRNRGYPTFLIIFERLAKKTRVHFHRVHPNRYKDGRPTPAHKLVEECYRYMAGNVRAEEIYRQQGDLIFMRVEEPKHNTAALKGVADFESHAFVVPKGKEPVLLLPNEAKSIKNRLGHLFAATEFTVDHPEHEPLKKMPSGWYEVRRCKSWEANPQAVWSFTID